MDMTDKEINKRLGDVESSNAFAKELVRRWNEFPDELKR